jgi:glutaredoxin
MANVVIYSSPTCTPCGTLKMYFDRQGIDYTVLNADEEPHATELLKVSGGRLLPTTVIGDSVIRGVNIGAIKEVLGV